MSRPQLKAALENLLAFPDMSFQEMSPPLAYYHRSRQEKQAKRFIELAADFVRAFEQEGDLNGLRMRTAPFAYQTGPGSLYQDLREAAYRRLSSAFENASPDGKAKRLSLARLKGDSRFPKLRVDWTDVDKHLGDPDSVLRFPSKTFEYCTWLIEFLSCSYPELVALGYELRGIQEAVEGTHLRGNFLLVTAHDIVHSVPQDVGRHRNLVETIVKSPETMVVAKAAAEDLVTALLVDDEQAAAPSPASARGGHAESTPMSTNAEVKPHWHAATSTLSYNGEVVKRFKQPAQNQKTVIAAFEAQGWPTKIADPFGTQRNTVAATKRLNDTVRSLNKKQSSKLIHFEADGTGKAIIWLPG